MTQYRAVTPRQRKFATAFVQNGGQGTEAALSAGFNHAGAPGVATRLLRNAAVLALIVGDCLRGASTAPDVLRSILRPTRPAVVRIRAAMLLAAPPAPVRTFGGRVHVMVSSDVEAVAEAAASIDGYASGYSDRSAPTFCCADNALARANNGYTPRFDAVREECAAAPAPTIKHLRGSRFVEAGGTPGHTPRMLSDSRSDGDLHEHTGATSKDSDHA